MQAGYAAGDTTRDKRSPDMLLLEPGAVLCRVSRSFLRFGHIELYALRQEYEYVMRNTVHDS